MPSLEIKNSICTQILDEVLQHHRMTSKGVGEYQSLAGIFFHEICIYLTGAYLILADEVYEGDLKFPYCNLAYLDRPIRIDFEKKKIHENSLYSLGIVGKTIGLGENVPFDSRLQKLAFMASNKPVSMSKSRFNLAHQKDQLDSLRTLILEISTKYNLCKAPDIFADNFIRYCESYLSPDENYIEKAFTLSGSNALIHNRLLSAQQIRHGGKAICVGHGEQSPFFLDEPIFFYGDMSYSTDFVSYGDARPDGHASERFILTAPPCIWSRDSAKVRAVRSSRGKSKGKILYVPTSYSANRRYGPFRDISDRDYMSWQQKIMESSSDITIKIHPKGQRTDLKWNYETRWLEDCIQEYDSYIIDYVSTASALCMATSKPVLFLNPGIRNLSQKGWESSKRRCELIELDLNETSAAIKKHIDVFEKYSSHQNRQDFTASYWLTENQRSLARILGSIMELTEV